METNKEAARISKEDFDSLCPFCKSPVVYLLGEHRANSHDSSRDSDYPEAEVEQWRCAACIKTFILF